MRTTSQRVVVENLPGMLLEKPVWSPDGTQIAYTDPQFRVFAVPAQGGTPKLLAGNIGYPRTWLPTDRILVQSLSTLFLYDIATT